MIEQKRDTPSPPYDQSPVNKRNMTISHAALLADMEQVFTEARPRLLRLAHLNGMPPDMADDIVQETMMEAWRHIENLRDPQRFHAWLDGICRNVCRRYQTPDGALHQHFSLSTLARDNETKNAADDSLALPDPFAIDPAEELSRQDLATLLDRAMEHLSPDTRKLLEMCYLAEIPQREAALQLGLTIGALELRLHRARKQLRQVLNGALRADAESFGLALDPVQVQGWRETRQWCWLCGKHRLIGLFEALPNGRVALRLRCPACFHRYGFDVISSGGLVSMEGLSSFRPAIKRLFQKMGESFWIPLTKGACFQCHGPALVSIIDSSDVSFPVPPDHYWVRTACSKCGISTTDISTVFVIGVTLLMGFRPTASFVAWIAALGVIALFTLALSWMSVVFGLVGKTPAGANSLSLIFQLLLFTSSALVGPDSMSGGVRWFAEYQPFTPVIDTVRGLLLGTPIGNSAVLAVAWCAGLTLVGYLWARAVYNRNSAR